MESPKSLKILWAVDAFDDLAEVQKTEIKVLQAMAKKLPLKIDPTYVLSPVDLGVSLELSGPWTETYIPSAKKALHHKLKDVSIPGLQEPSVHVQNKATLKGTVGVLTQLASSQHYDLIVAGSHGRKGFQRMMLGSFAEELLLQSKVPVLIVGSHSGTWKEGQIKILLPNDLSDPKSKIFDEVFKFAQALGAKVTILNSIPKPVEQVFQSGVYLLAGGWIPTPIYLEKEKSRQQEVAKSILAQAQSLGVQCDFCVDDQSLSVTEAVLNQAKQMDSNIVAMAAESGPIASALIGSITRQVVRSANCPVLVLRTTGQNKKG